MNAANDIFEGEAFRKPRGANNRRSPVNRSLLEAWGVALARCSQEQIDTLVERRDEVRRRFEDLCAEDDDFDRAICKGVGFPTHVKRRFHTIEAMVKEFA